MCHDLPNETYRDFPSPKVMASLPRWLTWTSHGILCLEMGSESWRGISRTRRPGKAWFSVHAEEMLMLYCTSVFGCGSFGSSDADMPMMICWIYIRPRTWCVSLYLIVYTKKSTYSWIWLDVHQISGVLFRMGDPQILPGYKTKLVEFRMIWWHDHFRKPPYI